MKLRTQRKFAPLKHYGFLPDTPELMVSLLQRGYTLSYIIRDFCEVRHMQAVLDAENILCKSHNLVKSQHGSRHLVKLGARLVE